MIGCYIIYSENADKYYTGVTQKDVDERLLKHNLHFYGSNHYTAMANDWQLFLFIECVSYNTAVKIERHIKKMKSRVYIENLKKYPAIISKLKEKYQ